MSKMVPDFKHGFLAPGGCWSSRAHTAVVANLKEAKEPAHVCTGVFKDI